MENKILVTGGHGLVGSEFINKQYFKPTSKDYDFNLCVSRPSRISIN